jgi:hemoglobin
MAHVVKVETADAETPYKHIGGEQAVRAVCARLYALMEELPEARACREIHPPSLERAEEKLFEFMSGWLGGPQLYREKYGHPRLRQRHFVAPIGNEETSGWLACFHQAWKEIVPASPLADDLAARIDALGWHMRNTDGEGDRSPPCGVRQQHRQPTDGKKHDR